MNKRERFRIGLILMTIGLIGTVIAGSLWVRSGWLVDVLLFFVNVTVFIYGMTLTIRNGNP